MKELIENWLKNNDFTNIQTTSDNHFIKADGLNTKLLILLKDNDVNFDVEGKNKVYEFAYRNGQRQIWYAEIINDEISWSLF